MTIRVLEPVGIKDVLTFLRTKATDADLLEVDKVLRERRRVVYVKCRTGANKRGKKA